MSSNQENIEAKLAAYVDGELSGADREEIERHLTANPQHRKLIIELSQARTMLQGLPRAKAPADVLDSLQSQLERSALLGSPEQLSGDDSYKIGFWTQFRAVAAILVLTCGLAAVVYYVLPRGEPRIEMAGGPSSDKNNPVTVEETTKVSPAPLERSSARSEMESKVALDNALAKNKDVADSMMPRASMGAGMGAGMGAATGFKLESKSGEGAVITPELHRQLMANGVSDAATYVVVDTADAVQANATASQYLNDNRLTWEQVPLLALAQAHPKLNKLDLSQLLTSPASVARDIQAHVLDKQSPNALEQVASAKAATDAANGGGGSPQGLTPSDSTARDLSPQAIQSSQAVQIPSQIVQPQSVPTNTANLIIARNLSPKQVAELNGLLSLQNAGAVSNYRAQLTSPQKSVNQTLPGAGATQTLPPAIVSDATTQASPQRIKAGDTLTLVIPDSGMGEVTITAEVDSAGLLSGVSTLGGTMVNGLTIDELNAAIVSRYRETNQMAMNNVGSVVPHATKITSPVDADAARDGLALQKQQIVAPVGAANEPTDVVIIVRDALSSAATSKVPAMALPVEATPAASIPPSTAPASTPMPVDDAAKAAATAAPATTQPTTQP